MHAAARIALVGLGLFATGRMVRGQTPDTPPATSQNLQKDPNADEITAVPNRPTFASTAEMVQLGVFEIEYGFEAGRGHQNINGLLKWGAVKNLELWFFNNPIQRDAGTAGLGDSGAGLKFKLFSQRKARPPTSLLNAATYNLSSRLVLDGGVYIGVYGRLPRVTAFAGLTYSVANIYHLQSRPASPKN